MKKINCDAVIGENTEKHNPDWRYITDSPYRILIVRQSCQSRKTNELLSLINHQSDDEILCLYAKDPYEKNIYIYFFIKKR